MKSNKTQRKINWQLVASGIIFTMSTIMVLFATRMSKAGDIGAVAQAVSTITEKGLVYTEKEINNQRLIAGARNAEIAKLLEEKIHEADLANQLIAKEAMADYTIIRCLSSIHSYISQLESEERIQELRDINNGKASKFFQKNRFCIGIDLRNR